MNIKIRIIGACGSGKSYISREISKIYNIPCFELDNLVWDNSVENTKYPTEVRNNKFREILNIESWVVEGAQSSWTLDSFERADFIFILNPNVIVRDYRIIKRFIRTRLGIEQWNYKQTFEDLMKMLVKWNHGYDLGKIIKLTQELKHKRYIIKNKEELIEIVDRFTS